MNKRTEFEIYSEKITGSNCGGGQWANNWGFKVSGAKTQVICFSRRHKEVSLKLYDQTLEEVKVIRLLGVLFDEKLTWKQHTDKVKDKCKKINNLL